MVAVPRRDTRVGLSNNDRTYLSHLVAVRTGLSQDDAQLQVDNAIKGSADGGCRAQGISLSRLVCPTLGREVTA